MKRYSAIEAPVQDPQQGPIIAFYIFLSSVSGFACKHQLCPSQPER